MNWRFFHLNTIQNVELLCKLNEFWNDPDEGTNTLGRKP